MVDVILAAYVLAGVVAGLLLIGIAIAALWPEKDGT